MEATGVYKWSRVPIIALPIRNLPEAAQMTDADLEPMLAEVMENGSSGSEPDADGAGEAGEDEDGVMRAFDAIGRIQGVADVIDAVVDENPFNGMVDNLEDAVALDQLEPEDDVPIVDHGVDEPADNAEPRQSMAMPTVNRTAVPAPFPMLAMHTKLLMLQKAIVRVAVAGVAAVCMQ